MAPATDISEQITNGVAASGKPHHRKVNRGNRPITPEQKQRIRELYAAGKTAKEIAREIGLGKTAVYNHLGLGKKGTPTWTDDEIQVLVDGYLEKKTAKEIAKKLGRSKGAVSVRMCRYRKEVRNNPKKRRALSAITMVLRAVRKADIFREIED